MRREVDSATTFSRWFGRLAALFIFSLGVAIADDAGSETKLITAGPPVYPMYCLEKNFQGYVEVEFVVDTKGLVKDPVVIDVAVYRRNPNKPIKDEKARSSFIWAAKEALENFRYVPPTEDGEPVELEGVRTTITFALE